ncbi:MAG TPA: hypothetical protein VJ828_15950 [Lacipirellulaceae bacterium]|nr:hypothetical protein [Lacipirellulaceae bacterium]
MAVAITEASTRISDIQPIWHRSAPRRIIEKCGKDGPLGDWNAWQNHLARRQDPVQPPFVDGREPAIWWGWPADSVDADLFNPDIWMDVEQLPERPELPQVLQLLALTYSLPRMSEWQPADVWWRLIERLQELTAETESYQVDWHTRPNDVLRHQLLAGELPLALGYLFPEIRPLRALRTGARAIFSEAIVAVTDGAGLPHARLLPVLGPLFACWTRARWLGSKMARGAWSWRAENQYRWLVRRAIRLTGKDRRFLLTPVDSPSRWSKPLFAMALDLAGDEADCAAAATALPSGVVPKSMQCNQEKLPKPSLDSDWSGISVLAASWSQSAPRLAVGYTDDPIRIDLSARGETLFAGTWSIETECDGKPAQVDGEWENLCWQSDKYCDYLELSVPLSEGLRLERQLLLAHKDQVLYLADIVVSVDGRARHIKHSSGLPLVEEVVWQPEADTRDGLLLAGKLRAAVLPLALPEWRIDPRGGTLAEKQGRLVLTQESTGRAMCCPLFFDLKSKRAKKERTWRQLTVAEWMEVLPRDVAVGFRAQSGGRQWLIYRSLGPTGNRTVLGHNIAGEFCAGRFRPSGKFKEWLEIEDA